MEYDVPWKARAKTGAWNENGPGAVARTDPVSNPALQIMVQSFGAKKLLGTKKAPCPAAQTERGGP